MRGHKLSDEKWIKILKEFESTTLSLVDFCKQHDIGESTFYQKRAFLTKYKKKKIVETVTPVVFEPVLVTTNQDIRMEINGVSIKGDIHVLRSLLGVDA
ncbi:IS66 family insertion sequence element accessory protein TnpA [Tannockella kyphosi]|uniref:IS66 family insertion sequence element accessory protein TnpA n=1 Tax=Tannockella kyphosi TaxID=2899121 RepID=UPI002013A9D0|nr:hypothetical protein [Tannockella kyphosi]